MRPLLATSGLSSLVELGFFAVTMPTTLDSGVFQHAVAVSVESRPLFSCTIALLYSPLIAMATQYKLLTNTRICRGLQATHSPVSAAHNIYLGLTTTSGIVRHMGEVNIALIKGE